MHCSVIVSGDRNECLVNVTRYSTNCGEASPTFTLSDARQRHTIGHVCRPLVRRKMSDWAQGQVAVWLRGSATKTSTCGGAVLGHFGLRRAQLDS